MNKLKSLRFLRFSSFHREKPEKPKNDFLFSIRDIHVICPDKIIFGLSILF